MIATPSPSWRNLDGEDRQRVAAALWRAWREGPQLAGIVEGFPGVGKTVHLAEALLAAAESAGLQGVLVDAPPDSVPDVEKAYLSNLAEALADASLPRAVDTIAAAESLAQALVALYDTDVLLILDDFHLHCPEGRAPRWFDSALKQAARHRGTGWFILLSNRKIEVDERLEDRCLFVTLSEPQTEPLVAASILEGANPDHGLGDRRDEAIARLGANPRALVLLANALRHHTVDELLGPREAPAAIERDRELIAKLERQILNKALAGLDAPTRAWLSTLSVLRAPADDALLEAMAADVDWKAARNDLRARHLLRIRRSRNELHPLVVEIEGERLRRAPERCAEAHRRAGHWYARPFSSGTIRLGQAGRFEEARHHLLRAGDEIGLAGLLTAIYGSLARDFPDNAKTPATDEERDARIELLSACLVTSGPPGPEEHLARLLFKRGRDGDFEAALLHAGRAVDEEPSDADAWVLWIKLVRLVEGLEATVSAAERAIRHVDPTKSLFSVYQLLGAALEHLGRTDEAIARLWEGYQKDKRKNRVRLVEEALFFAAAAPTLAPLENLLTQLQGDGDVALVRSLCQVLILERQSRWAEAADCAAAALGQTPEHLHLALHQALGWLGANQPDRARAALDARPNTQSYSVRSGATWLHALVAMHNQRHEDAARLAAVYLGSPALPAEEAVLRACLLREWDHRVATVGEANPALGFPILPPSVTGLAKPVVRPQHGEPVLPPHLTTPPPTPATAAPPPPASSAPLIQTMPPSPPSVPPLLAEAKRAGTLVPFVGAGLSLGSDVSGDFPPWSALPERLLVACDRHSVWYDDAEKARIRGQFLRPDPADPAKEHPVPMTLRTMLRSLDALKDRLGHDYAAAIEALFRPQNAAPGAAHRALVALNAMTILTTNLDELIEIAEPSRAAYTGARAADALRDIQTQRPVLFKVHGTANDPESYVLTLDEYKRAHSDEAYRKLLDHLLIANSFLFVGFGMEDPYDLDLVLEENAAALKGSGKPHFALMRHLANEQDDVNRFEHLRDRFRVRVIAYDNHDQISPFLEALARI